MVMPYIRRANGIQFSITNVIIYFNCCKSELSLLVFISQRLVKTASRLGNIRLL